MVQQKKVLWISDFGILPEELEGLKQFFGTEINVKRLAVKDAKTFDDVLTQAEGYDCFAFGNRMPKEVVKGLLKDDSQNRPVLRSLVKKFMVIAPCKDGKTEIFMERQFRCWKLITDVIDDKVKAEDLF